MLTLRFLFNVTSCSARLRCPICVCPFLYFLSFKDVSDHSSPQFLTFVALSNICLLIIPPSPFSANPFHYLITPSFLYVSVKFSKPSVLITYPKNCFFPILSRSVLFVSIFLTTSSLLTYSVNGILSSFL